MISIPVFVLAEANLSMLGLGVAEPLPSLGGLLRELENFSALAAHIQTTDDFGFHVLERTHLAAGRQHRQTARSRVRRYRYLVTSKHVRRGGMRGGDGWPLYLSRYRDVVAQAA